MRIFCNMQIEQTMKTNQTVLNFDWCSKFLLIPVHLICSDFAYAYNILPLEKEINNEQ